MNIKKFADACGVSVRTVRFYNEAGLLSPSFVDKSNGYRHYDGECLLRMQEILFYRELDFPIKEIKAILSSPDYDKKGALREQRRLLLLKKERLERIIAAIDSAEEGASIDMSTFDNSEYVMYTEEVKRRWGDTAAYKESIEKSSAGVAEGIEAIMADFAAAMTSGVKPADSEAQSLVARLQDFITKTQYKCTNEILACLVEMYIGDERFKANIDRFGDGTAQFAHDAIQCYVK